MTISQTPEPQDSPIVRASDDDRDAVAAQLNDAQADGRLTAEEHAERLAATWAARTRNELNAITWDLGPSTLVVPQQSDAVHTYSIFGDTRREGTWLLPSYFSNLTIFGDTKLDLREATFSAMAVEINLSVGFGDVKIWVPDGVTVVDETIKVLGDAKLQGLAPARPGAPTIAIRGFIVLGDLRVYGSGHKSWAEKLGLR